MNDPRVSMGQLGVERDVQHDDQAKQKIKQSNALRQLFRDFEDQVEQELCEQDDQASLSSTEVEQQLPEQETLLGVSHAMAAIPEEEMKDDGTPMSWTEEPKLFLCDARGSVDCRVAASH